MFTNDYKSQLKGVFSSKLKPLEKGKQREIRLDYYCEKRNQKINLFSS